MDQIKGFLGEPTAAEGLDADVVVLTQLRPGSDTCTTRAPCH